MCLCVCGEETRKEGEDDEGCEEEEGGVVYLDGGCHG